MLSWRSKGWRRSCGYQRQMLWTYMNNQYNASWTNLTFSSGGVTENIFRSTKFCRCSGWNKLDFFESWSQYWGKQCLKLRNLMMDEFFKLIAFKRSFRRPRCDLNNQFSLHIALTRLRFSLWSVSLIEMRINAYRWSIWYNENFTVKTDDNSMYIIGSNLHRKVKEQNQDHQMRRSRSNDR